MCILVFTPLIRVNENKRREFFFTVVHIMFV